MTDIAQQVKPTPQEFAMMALLAKTGTISIEKISELAVAENIAPNAESVSTCLARLMKKNLILRHGRGNYGPHGSMPPVAAATGQEGTDDKPLTRVEHGLLALIAAHGTLRANEYARLAQKANVSRSESRVSNTLAALAKRGLIASFGNGFYGLLGAEKPADVTKPRPAPRVAREQKAPFSALVALGMKADPHTAAPAAVEGTTPVAWPTSVRFQTREPVPPPQETDPRANEPFLFVTKAEHDGLEAIFYGLTKVNEVDRFGTGSDALVPMFRTEAERESFLHRLSRQRIIRSIDTREQDGREIETFEVDTAALVKLIDAAPVLEESARYVELTERVVKAEAQLAAVNDAVEGARQLLAEKEAESNRLTSYLDQCRSLQTQMRKLEVEAMQLAKFAG